MMRRAFLLLLISLSVYSEEINRKLRIFIDCATCDMDYIKESIKFVDFVRDKDFADVYILIIARRTGSGGRKYTLLFSGQKNFVGKSDTLYFVTEPASQEAEIRSKLVKMLKLGLMRFVAHTPVKEDIYINFIEKKRISVKDRWHRWVFKLSGFGNVYFEQSQAFFSFSGGLSASRVTEELKFSSNLYGSYYANYFVINDTEKIYSYSESYGYGMGLVKSLGEHFSAGFNFSIYSSSYSNIKLALSPSISFEYSLFPYSQAMTHAVCLALQTSYSNRQYIDTTIFNKIREELYRGATSFKIEIIRKWGSVKGMIVYSSYFHDFTKNRLSFITGISLRIARGLSLNIFGNLEMIHDQLALPKRGLTYEEILLQRKMLATQYRYSGNIGLTYSFGSIYSEIVNPRLTGLSFSYFFSY